MALGDGMHRDREIPISMAIASNPFGGDTGNT